MESSCVWGEVNCSAQLMGCGPVRGWPIYKLPDLDRRWTQPKSGSRIAQVIDLLTCRFSIKRIRLSYQRLGRSHGTSHGRGRHQKSIKGVLVFASHSSFIPTTRTHPAAAALPQPQPPQTQLLCNAFRCFIRCPHHPRRRVDPIVDFFRDRLYGFELVHQPQLSPMLPLWLARRTRPQLPLQVNVCSAMYQYSYHQHPPPPSSSPPLFPDHLVHHRLAIAFMFKFHHCSQSFL
ncbi:hypothetical protein BDN70DRAFT_137481 [Pholiota conissans]|uniref:Uncharacterized protein n=1 Tax=Pholiota conissans TaxID=109636 RepID=A0A9P5YYL2_9AGAR|nr:hypothetical protein BDN70DRAFT_137481 [Pholiota conissans]